jgi:hypothetical protein
LCVIKNIGVLIKLTIIRIENYVPELLVNLMSMHWRYNSIALTKILWIENILVRASDIVTPCC